MKEALRLAVTIVRTMKAQLVSEQTVCQKEQTLCMGEDLKIFAFASVFFLIISACF